MIGLLQSRFDSLPFHTGRIAKHIAAGNVCLGDFMRFYESAVIMTMKSRPAGRATLRLGDRARYREMQWRVTAVDGPAIYFEVMVELPHRTPRLATVEWIGRSELSIGCENIVDRSMIAELFAPVGLDMSKIDAWDWTPGVDMNGRKIEPLDDDNITGEWLVVTPRATFVWDSVAHSVRPVSRTNMARGPLVDYVSSLFERPPTIVEV